MTTGDKRKFYTTTSFRRQVTNAVQIFTPLPPSTNTSGETKGQGGLRGHVTNGLCRVFGGQQPKSKGLIGGEPSSSSSCNRLEGRENLRTDYKCSWGERNGCCLSSPRSSPHGSQRHTTWLFINIEAFAAEYLIQGVSKKRYFLDFSVLEVGFYFFTCVSESEF